MKRLAICLLLASAAATALAEEVEVIPLRYRTFEQVAPVLRALVEPGGALSGMQSTIVIRSSRSNIEDIKRVLASIDTVPRRLLISVRQDAGVEAARQGVGASGTAGSRNRIEAQVYNSRSATDERVSQQVQTLEGAPASIQVGRSVPIQTQTIQRSINGVIVTDNVGYRDVSTGVTVVPRLAGDRVSLEIRPQRESIAASAVRGGAPTINTQQIVTTASGQLGEWIELGGFVQDDRSDQRGLLSSASAARQDNRRVWVKVDEIK